MARKIIDKQNTQGAGGEYPFGKIRDESAPGTNDGTPINDEVYGDFHQFFAKLANDANINLNGLPENSNNGFQFMEALTSYIRQRTRPIAFSDVNIDEITIGGIGNPGKDTWQTISEYQMPDNDLNYIVTYVGKCSFKDLFVVSNNSSVDLRIRVTVDDVASDQEFFNLVLQQATNPLGKGLRVPLTVYDSRLRSAVGQTLKLQVLMNGDFPFTTTVDEKFFVRLDPVY